MVISRAEDFCDTGESVSEMRVIMVMRVMMYVSQSLSAMLYTCEVLARVHKSFQKSPSLNLITSSLSLSLSVTVFVVVLVHAAFVTSSAVHWQATVRQNYLYFFPFAY